jgi:hypothetical protein
VTADCLVCGEHRGEIELSGGPLSDAPHGGRDEIGEPVGRLRATLTESVRE